MEDYARYFRVSFGKEDNDHGEFIAFPAPSGDPKGKSLDGPQALSAVQPSVSALGSLSSVARHTEGGQALSSGPARANITPETCPVHSLERITP